MFYWIHFILLNATILCFTELSLHLYIHICFTEYTSYYLMLQSCVLLSSLYISISTYVLLNTLCTMVCYNPVFYWTLCTSVYPHMFYWIHFVLLNATILCFTELSLHLYIHIGFTEYTLYYGMLQSCVLLNSLYILSIQVLLNTLCTTLCYNPVFYWTLCTSVYPHRFYWIHFVLLYAIILCFTELSVHLYIHIGFTEYTLYYFMLQSCVLLNSLYICIST